MRGFTLVELMVTLAVLSVIALISYPFIKDLLIGMEVRHNQAIIMQTLRDAKVHTQLYHHDVLVCLQGQDTACTAQDGIAIMMFWDKNQNKRFDAPDVLLQSSPLKTNYGKIHSRFSLRRSYLRYFAGQGKPRGHYGHIQYCTLDQTRAQFERRIVIDSGGKVSNRTLGCYAKTR